MAIVDVRNDALAHNAVLHSDELASEAFYFDSHWLHDNPSLKSWVSIKYTGPSLWIEPSSHTEEFLQIRSRLPLGIEFSDESISRRMMKTMNESLPNVTWMSFRNCKFDENACDALASFQDVRQLELSRCQVPGAFLNDAVSLSHLESVVARNVVINEGELLSIGSAPALKAIVVEQNGRANPWKVVGSTSRIESLTWASSDVTDLTYRELPPLCYLRCLRLSNSRSRISIGPSAIEALMRLPRLEYVNLSDVSVESNGLDKCDGHARLVAISLEESEIGPELARWLVRCPRLCCLTLKNCRIGANAFAALKSIRTLRFLDLEGSSICEAELRHICSGSKVQTLLLGSCTEIATRSPITDRALTALATCRSIRRIDLSGCDVTIDGVVEYLKHSGVREVIVQSTSMKDNLRVSVDGSGIKILEGTIFGMDEYQEYLSGKH